MRRGRALLLMLPLLIMVAGCVALPQPITQRAPKVEPSWTLTEARTTRQALLARFARAATKGDVTAATADLTDSDRLTVLGEFNNAELNRRKVDTNDWRAGSVVSLWSTPKAVFPQTAFALVKLTKEREKGSPHLLEVYTRSGAAARWLRSSTVTAKSATGWPASGSVVASAPVRINGLDTQRVPQLVTAINQPSRERDAAFTQNTPFLSYRKYLQTTVKDKGVSTATLNFSVRISTSSFRVGDDCYLVVSGTATAATTLKSGHYYRYANPLKKTFPKREYHGLVETYSVAMLVRVPAKGRITIQDQYLYETDYQPYE